MATSGVLFRKAENPATSVIILSIKPGYVRAPLNTLSKIISMMGVCRIMSPSNRRSRMTTNCTFANPLRISAGVKMRETPRTEMAITNVNDGPSISKYRDINMNARTTNTMSTS